MPGTAATSLDLLLAISIFAPLPADDPDEDVPEEGYPKPKDEGGPNKPKVSVSRSVSVSLSPPLDNQPFAPVPLAPLTEPGRTDGAPLAEPSDTATGRWDF